MLPQVFGVPTYYASWVIAALVGVAYACYSGRGLGIDSRKTLSVGLIEIGAMLIGGKLLYLAEGLFLPLTAPGPLHDVMHPGPFWFGFRLPGALLLGLIVLPLVCKVVDLHVLPFADAMIPAVNLGIVVLRIGCFSNGCCFGLPSALPWAIEFPAGAAVYDWQIKYGLITSPHTHSLPVHPLQLYFVACAALLFLASHRWQERKKYDGQVLLKSSFWFFTTTFALEFLRGYRVPLNMVVTGIAAALALAMRLWVEWRAVTLRARAVRAAIDV